MKKIIIIILLLFIPLFVKADEESLLVTISKGDNNSLVLNWNNIDGVIEYQVYRSTNSSGGFKSVVKSEENTYTDKKLIYGKTYYYKVVALFEDRKITSEIVNKKVIPNKVENLVLKPGNKKIELSYDKTKNNGYVIYRSTNGEDWSKIKTLYKDSIVNYTDSNLKTNKKYYYKIRSYQIVNGKKIYGKYSEVVSAKTAPGKADISIKATAYNKITINISSVKGASYYQIKRSLNKKDYEIVTSTTELTYVDESINPTVTYYYKVRACNSEKKCGSYSSVKSTKTKIKIPTISGSALVTEVNLNWTTVSYADGYQVYFSEYKDKKYTKIKNVSDITLNKTDLIPGKKYYFKVRTYVIKNEKKYYSSYSNIISLKPNLKKVGGIKLSATPNSVNIKWNNVFDATGYQIYRSKSKNGTYTKIKTTSDTSYINTSLKSKTTYYYKIRAKIKIGDKNYYGPYSSIVNIKTPAIAVDYTRVLNAVDEIMSSSDDSEYVIDRDILKSELIWSYEFSDIEIDYAIKNANINWKEKAKKEVSFYNESTSSRNEIIDDLKEKEYTDEEINYALENNEIDFNDNAHTFAYNNWEYYSEDGLKNKIISIGFSEEEAQNAINRVRDEANYIESAKNIFKKDIDELFSIEEIENDLENKLFTSEEIENALLLSSEYNFNEIAFERAFSVVDENNNIELMQTYLQNAKFTNSEIEYALNTLFKEITSTVDLINLNDPIMINYKRYGSSCGSYAFIKISTDIFIIENELVQNGKIFNYYDEAEEAINSLVLDEEKTNSTLEALNNLPIQKGVNETTSGLENGRINLFSGRLKLSNPTFYNDFGSSFEELYTEYDNNLDTLLDDAYLVIGGCDEIINKQVRLTMDICNEYNLTCDAW